MATFIVELRANTFNASETDTVEGWIGLVHRGNRYSPALGCVSNANAAMIYDTRGQAECYCP